MLSCSSASRPCRTSSCASAGVDQCSSTSLDPDLQVTRGLHIMIPSKEWAGLPFCHALQPPCGDAGSSCAGRRKGSSRNSCLCVAELAVNGGGLPVALTVSFPPSLRLWDLLHILGLRMYPESKIHLGIRRSCSSPSPGSSALAISLGWVGVWATATRPSGDPSPKEKKNPAPMPEPADQTTSPQPLRLDFISECPAPMILSRVHGEVCQFCSRTPRATREHSFVRDLFLVHLARRF